MIGLVKNRRGDTLSIYTPGAVVVRPQELRKFIVDGEQMELEAGLNYVTVTVNGTQAERPFRYEVGSPGR